MSSKGDAWEIQMVQAPSSTHCGKQLSEGTAVEKKAGTKSTAMSWLVTGLQVCSSEQRFILLLQERKKSCPCGGCLAKAYVIYGLGELGIWQIQ